MDIRYEIIYYYYNYLLFTFCLCSVQPQKQKLTVKSGDDAPLQCQAPTDKEIILVEWTLSKLPKDDDVVFYWNKDKDKISQKQNQNPAYRDRVELMDPWMTHGKVLVKLKNVSSSDRGTYRCRVTREAGKPPDLYSTIWLEVEESGEFKEMMGEDIQQYLPLLLPVVAVTVPLLALTACRFLRSLLMMSYRPISK
uniref:Ig-like domain-containing protein n=1 Tax=Fundulus heteroclitus TaxID=8078 RepID=A0A3Q2PI67_FUNHE